MKTAELVNSSMKILSICTKTVCLKPNHTSLRGRHTCLFLLSHRTPSSSYKFPHSVGSLQKKNHAGCSCGFLQLLDVVFENFKHISITFSCFWSETFQWHVLSADNSNPRELKRFVKTSVKIKAGKKAPSRFQSTVVLFLTRHPLSALELWLSRFVDLGQFGQSLIWGRDPNSSMVSSAGRVLGSLGLPSSEMCQGFNSHHSSATLPD